jgi:hypothetical protein
MNEVNRIIQQAGQALTNSHTMLKELLDDSDSTGGSTTDGVQILQLILQYRLDTQDALLRLLDIDHGLLQILGIGPQHSARVNLERMKFALGNDDLNHILRALSQLLQSLSLVAHRYQQNLTKTSAQKRNQLSMRAEASHSKLTERLQEATVLQKLFTSSMTELSDHLNLGDRTAEIGLVLDHVKALRGPVSQFFQAVQSGLELTHKLYEKTYASVPLENTLSDVLQQTKTLLNQLKPMYQPQHFFTPVKDNVAEQLEIKAAIKRLRPFF